MKSQERRPSWGLVIAFAIAFAVVVGAALLAGCARSRPVAKDCEHLAKSMLAQWRGQAVEVQGFSSDGQPYARAHFDRTGGWVRCEDVTP